MKKKIAIPTNDRTTIAERSGRAAEFMVVEWNKGNIMSSEFRKNTHSHHHHEGEHEGETEHSHAELVSLLSDCQYILAQRVGKHFKKDLSEAGKTFILTHTTDISQALQELDI